MNFKIKLGLNTWQTMISILVVLHVYYLLKLHMASYQWANKNNINNLIFHPTT
jgi:hypothetical protein